MIDGCVKSLKDTVVRFVFIVVYALVKKNNVLRNID